MLGMISSQRHSHHTSSDQEPSARTTLADTEQTQSKQGSTTATKAHPTAVNTSEEGCSTAAGESSAEMGGQGPRQHPSKASQSAVNAESAANKDSSAGSASSNSASGQVSPSIPAASEAAPVSATAAGDAAAPAAQARSADEASAADMLQYTDEQHPGSHDTSQASCNDEVCSGDCKPDDRQTNSANGRGGSQAETPNGHSALAISQAVSIDEEVNGATDKCGTVDGAALGNGSSCQSSGNGKQQPQQAEQSNGTAGVDGQAPRTPTRKAPKKGGLVNVQRPAVKGYSIHRSPPSPPLLLLTSEKL